MKLIQHPAAWTPQVLNSLTDRWQYTLSNIDVQELTAALRAIQVQKKIVPNITKDDFPIPRLMAKLASFKNELEHGLGVLYIKGLPVEQLSKDEASAIFWGLGMHFGKPWEQNQRGHLLGDVINEGKSLNDNSARGYQTTATLDMHTDGADIVALLCLKQAPIGGESQILSAIAAYNLLLERSPDILQHLIDHEWCIDWRDENPPSDKPYHKAKIFEQNKDGLVTCFALIAYIFSAQRHRATNPEIPELSEFDQKALNDFLAVCEDPSLLYQYKLQAGDMTFLNNHFHLHGRSFFEDADDPKERRHLRRLWIEAESWKDIRPKAMQNIWNNARNYWTKPNTPVQMWD